MSRPSDYTLGEFRKLTGHLPDSTPIARYNSTNYEFSAWETPSDVGLWSAVRCKYVGDFELARSDSPPEDIVEIVLI